LTRLLLKLSGEALGGESGFGLSPEVLQSLCQDLRGLVSEGVELAVVVGVERYTHESIPDRFILW